MTSKQVLLLIATALLIGGCSLLEGRGADPLHSPYLTRRVWAVAPLRNESGSLQADGQSLADDLVGHLENASNLDVLPVNRVLAAMEALDIAEVSTPAEAKQLLRALGVDGLVVGTITAYDPYDPPKLGLAVELYVNEQVEYYDSLNVRALAQASTDPGTLPDPPALIQPINSVSAVLDASDPVVRKRLMRYAVNRGQVKETGSWHLYRISMDLYSDFASYVMSWRLLRAETLRVTPPEKQASSRL